MRQDNKLSFLSEIDGTPWRETPKIHRFQRDLISVLHQCDTRVMFWMSKGLGVGPSLLWNIHKTNNIRWSWDATSSSPIIVAFSFADFDYKTNVIRFSTFEKPCDLCFPQQHFPRCAFRSQNPENLRFFAMQGLFGKWEREVCLLVSFPWPTCIRDERERVA